MRLASWIEKPQVEYRTTLGNSTRFRPKLNLVDYEHKRSIGIFCTFKMFIL